LKATSQLLQLWRLPLLSDKKAKKNQMSLRVMKKKMIPKVLLSLLMEQMRLTKTKRQRMTMMTFQMMITKEANF
jgi:hypothetical protein